MGNKLSSEQKRRKHLSQYEKRKFIDFDFYTSSQLSDAYKNFTEFVNKCANISKTLDENLRKDDLFALKWKSEFICDKDKSDFMLSYTEYTAFIDACTGIVNILDLDDENIKNIISF